MAGFDPKGQGGLVPKGMEGMGRSPTEVKLSRCGRKLLAFGVSM